MNCRIFSDLVSEIVRDQMMDAAARTHALAHADECLNCARQLEAESRLSTELKELASETSEWTASTQVWDNLNAAFDARTITPASTNRRWYYAAAAIAAMLLLAFTVFSIKRRPHPAIQAAATIPLPSAVTNNVANNHAPEDKQSAPVVQPERKMRRVNHQRQLVASQRPAQQLNQSKEIVTDFIQLTYGDPGLGGGAQIVRVELPRSAMANFGLPVNVDRADQRVKADVLLGVDGLAHAIRFVQ